jgi:ribosomal protein S18 acetylase RimI-like enzyme
MQSHVPPTDVAIAPVTVQDFAMLRELAGAIWRQHYTGIISAAQIEHMLAGRFTDAALREHIQATDKWLELLRVSGVPAGYCACELTALSGGGDGSGGGPPAMKLGQLYVLESHRGTGLGRFMLGHVERRARDRGKRSLWLQVNKRNPAAIFFYKAAGFTIAREAVFDIGSGFVMDDYIMEKRLGAK